MDPTSLNGLQLNPIEWVFALCALTGSALFLARPLVRLAGGASPQKTVSNPVSVHLGEPDSDYRLFSPQGMTGFLILFGLVGLILERITQAGDLGALMGAVAAGLFTAWLIQRACRFSESLQDSPVGLSEQTALGQEGMVFTPIPAEGGTGKVQIAIEQRLVEMEAVSFNREAIPSGQRIRVRKLSGNLLVVETIRNLGSG